MLVSIDPIDPNTGVGDCLEFSFDPNHFRRYIEERSNYTIIIRQTDINRWRMWKQVIR